MANFAAFLVLLAASMTLVLAARQSQINTPSVQLAEQDVSADAPEESNSRPVSTAEVSAVAASKSDVVAEREGMSDETAKIGSEAESKAGEASKDPSGRISFAIPLPPMRPPRTSPNVLRPRPPPLAIPARPRPPWLLSIPTLQAVPDSQENRPGSPSPRENADDLLTFPLWRYLNNDPRTVVPNNGWKLISKPNDGGDSSKAPQVVEATDPLEVMTQTSEKRELASLNILFWQTLVGGDFRHRQTSNQDIHGAVVSTEPSAMTAESTQEEDDEEEPQPYAGEEKTKIEDKNQEDPLSRLKTQDAKWTAKRWSSARAVVRQVEAVLKEVMEARSELSNGTAKLVAIREDVEMQNPDVQNWLTMHGKSVPRFERKKKETMMSLDEMISFYKARRQINQAEADVNRSSALVDVKEMKLLMVVEMLISKADAKDLFLRPAEQLEAARDAVTNMRFSAYELSEAKRALHYGTKLMLALQEAELEIDAGHDVQGLDAAKDLLRDLVSNMELHVDKSRTFVVRMREEASALPTAEGIQDQLSESEESLKHYVTVLQKAKEAKMEMDAALGARAADMNWRKSKLAAAGRLIQWLLSETERDVKVGAHAVQLSKANLLAAMVAAETELMRANAQFF